MENLYHQTNKLIQQTQQTFQRLESTPNSYVEIETDIQEKITQINRYVIKYREGRFRFVIGLFVCFIVIVRSWMCTFSKFR